jgi:bifunctional NMN adenylyltransferase/nudix hydrolase
MMTNIAKDFPSMIACADVLIYKTIQISENNYSPRYLLVKKPKDKEFRLVGGFSSWSEDPALNDMSLQQTAKREALEETSLTTINGPYFITSLQIDDERYKDDVHKIMSVLFSIGVAPEAEPVLKDDLSGGSYQWFSYQQLKEVEVIKAHKPLLKEIIEWAAINEIY